MVDILMVKCQHLVYALEGELVCEKCSERVTLEEMMLQNLPETREYDEELEWELTEHYMDAMG